MTPRGVLYHVYGYYHMLISMVVSLSDKVFFFMLFLHSNHLVFTTLLLPLYNLHCEVYVYVCINWHCFTLCVCVCVHVYLLLLLLLSIGPEFMDGESEEHWVLFVSILHFINVSGARV